MADHGFKIRNNIGLAPQLTQPTNPVAGDIYFDATNGLMQYKAGQWVQVGSGSGGSGTLNYISNGNFENNTIVPFITFANAAASTPPNNGTAGTGGSPTVSLAINSTNPLAGQYDAILTKPAGNYQGQGTSVDFQIDNIYAGQTMEIDLAYKIGGGFVTGANSDLQFFLLDKDAAQLV